MNVLCLRHECSIQVDSASQRMTPKSTKTFCSKGYYLDVNLVFMRFLAPSHDSLNVNGACVTLASLQYQTMTNCGME